MTLFSQRSPEQRERAQRAVGYRLAAD